jgi:cobaltochelatase CobS
MKTLNKNDILKKFIRSNVDDLNGRLISHPTVTGTMIAKANRDILTRWCETLGRDVQTVLDCNGELPASVTDLTRLPKDEPAPTPAPTRQVSSDDKAKVVASLLDQLGGGNYDDSQITARLDAVEKALNHSVKNVTVKVADLPKVECGKVHKSFEKLLAVASNRLHAFLVGEAGSFKTSSAEKVAKTLGLEYSSISVCMQTTASSLLGYMDATGNYVSTEFRKRYETGGVFILDEIDNGNANVLSVLNSALANGSCAFADGMVAKHKDFILIATANTFGNGANAQYVGRNQLDSATLDRFVTIEWNYDEALEMAIASNKDWCAVVQKYRFAVSKLGLRLVVSPRATFQGEKLLASGLKEKDVIKMVITRGASADQIKKINQILKG